MSELFPMQCLFHNYVCMFVYLDMCVCVCACVYSLRIYWPYIECVSLFKNSLGSFELISGTQIQVHLKQFHPFGRGVLPYHYTLSLLFISKHTRNY